MKKIALTLMVGFLAFTTFAQNADKLVSKNGHINFYSHTVAEDITADNYKVVSTLNTKTGEVVYSVPMQGFEFKKAMMQKHFNQKGFLNTKKFPKAKFVGQVVDFSKIDLSKDGTYPVSVKGTMTIKGESKEVNEKGTITVKDGKVSIDSKMKITLADYGIVFSKGKPASNIAKDVDVTVKVSY